VIEESAGEYDALLHECQELARTATAMSQEGRSSRTPEHFAGSQLFTGIVRAAGFTSPFAA
jgi:hypothetical protein